MPTLSGVTTFKDAQKDVHPPFIQPRQLCVGDTAKKSAFSDAAAFRDAKTTCVPRHSYSHVESVSSDTAKKTTFSDVAAFSVAQKRRAPRHSYNHDKFVFSDTSKKSAFSDVAVLSDAQKTCVPPIHTATTSPCLVTRLKRQRLVALQRLVTLRKHVYSGIHTITTSLC